MKATPTQAGRVVISTQGHDAGSWYAILRVLDERMVLLVNGTTRTLAKPKKKQVKHLRALPITIAVEGKGESGGPLCDGDIHKALKQQQVAYETKTGFAHTSARQQNEKEERALVQK